MRNSAFTTNSVTINLRPAITKHGLMFVDDSSLFHSAADRQ